MSPSSRTVSTGPSHRQTAFENHNLTTDNINDTDNKMSNNNQPNPVVSNAPRTLAAAAQSAIDAAQSPTTLSSTPTAHDQHLFSHPAMITGTVLLDLASRWSNREITEYTKQALTPATVSRRLSRALSHHAAEVHITTDQAWAELDKKKQANGLTLNTHYFRSPASVDSNYNATYSALKGTASTSTASTNAHPDHTGNGTEIDADGALGGKSSQTTNAQDDAQQQNSDRAAFADPNSLHRERLLILAERYTDQQIVDKISEVAQNIPITLGGLRTRIRTALNDRAKASSSTIQKARANFVTTRKGNGIRTRTAANGVHKITKSEPATLDVTTIKVQGNAEIAKAEPAPQAIVAADVQGGVEMIDAELANTDDESDDEGWSADELDAANILLTMVAGKQGTRR